MNTLLHLVGDVAVWVALASAIAFCVTYTLVAPWWSTGEGRHLMAFTAVVGLAFGWLAYRLVTGPHHVLPVTTEAPRASMYTALAGLLVWRLALLLRTQIRRRKRGRT